MKVVFPFICVAGIIIAASSCDTSICEEEVTYISYEPVYKGIEEIRNAVTVESPRELNRTGGLYIYGDLLLIGEPGQGIHLYDNSDPRLPNPISFIKLAGNQGMSARDDILYADNYGDLFLFDISTGENPAIAGRVDNVFDSHYAVQEQLLAIDYVETEQKVVVDCNQPTWFFLDDRLMVSCNSSFDIAADQSGSLTSAIAELTGTGGSLARFTISEDHLYTVDPWGLEVFDISNKTEPIKGNRVDLGWGIETIFPYEEFLFFGSESGMFIYSISDPGMPSFVSIFEHARVCDPVFVSEDIAYVTLRNGTECQGFINQLDVINISNISQPSLIESVAMDNPHGLSVRDQNVFICEGDFGFKVFNRTEDGGIDENILTLLDDVHATDVISISADHLLIIGRDGLYQYDSTVPSDLKLLSHIASDNG